MDARYVQRGDAIDYTPMADVAAGDMVVLAGKVVGVAKLDIKAGELGALALAGVYEVAKAPGAAFDAGAEVGWNPSEKRAEADGAVKLGHAVAAAAATDATVLVRLCQGMN